jgi:hypothetical protein
MLQVLETPTWAIIMYVVAVITFVPIFRTAYSDTTKFRYIKHLNLTAWVSQVINFVHQSDSYNQVTTL